MADLLIRGMEMPKSCEDCPLVEETENYFGDIMSRVCNLIYKGYTSEATKGRRRDDCPLVPLPEGHGRLGDLDKINASLGAMMEIEDNHNDAPYSWSHAYTEMQSILDDAPTIVPAEGGTDECSEN